MRRARGLALAAVAILCLGGCTDEVSGDVPDTSPTGPTFEALIQSALDDAAASGVDPSQVAALEAAKAVGEVTVEAFADAQRRSFECMESAGLTVEEIADAPRDGLPYLAAVIDAPVDMPDATKLQLVDDCMLRFSKLLETVYVQQPSSLNAYFDRIDDHREELIACLRERGATLDDDASIDELFVANEEINLQEAEKGQPYDCMLEVGAIDM